MTLLQVVSVTSSDNTAGLIFPSLALKGPFNRCPILITSTTNTTLASMNTLTRNQLPPELYREIVALLAERYGPYRFLKSLFALCLVSKTFNDIVIPFIYRDVNISGWELRHSVHRLKSLAKNDLAARSVRYLVVRLKDAHTVLNPFHRLLTQVIPRLSKLQGITIQGKVSEGSIGRYSLEQTPSFFSRIRSWDLELSSKTYQELLPGFLAQHCHDLEYFDIKAFDGLPVSFTRPLADHVSFQNLQTLVINWPSACMLLLDRRFPRLENVQLDFDYQDFRREEANALVSIIIKWARVQKETGSVKSFRLSMGNADIDSAYLIDQITCIFSCLESLRIESTREATSAASLLEEVIRYQVGDSLARMSQLCDFFWDDPYYRHCPVHGAFLKDARLVHHFGKECPTLVDCFVPGISYFWKRIAEDMWVPNEYSKLHDLLWDKTYPGQDALFRHLCNLSNGSTAISRCIDRYRQADPCSTEVTTDLMVVIAYLGACDYPYDNDHGCLKDDAEYDYEERIQRILAE